MACESLQGYCFSRSVPAAQIPALLARQRTLEDKKAVVPLAGAHNAIA